VPKKAQRTSAVCRGDGTNPTLGTRSEKDYQTFPVGRKKGGGKERNHRLIAGRASFRSVKIINQKAVFEKCGKREGVTS